MQMAHMTVHSETEGAKRAMESRYCTRLDKIMGFTLYLK